jgi:signal transduction histidine kinase/ligand-binding sensor domain-containing protein
VSFGFLWQACSRALCAGILVTVWLATGNSWASSAYPELEDQMVDLWNTGQGLPQGTVNAIAQTADGYLWVATDGGLARFDGVRFQHFNSRNTPTLGSDRVTALRSEGANGLWIGLADGGVCRLTDGRFQRSPVTDANGGTVTALAAAGENGLWIGSSGGLRLWREDRQAPAPDAASEFPREVLGACETGPGRVVVLDRRGLWETSGEQVRKLRTPSNVGEETWRGIAASDSGGVWLFGESARSPVIRLSADGTGVANQPVMLETGDKVSAACQRGDGSLWLGTTYGNLMLAGREAKFSGTRNITDRRRPAVRCLFEDRELNLWVGLDGGGLGRMKPKRVRTFGFENGLPGERITGMCGDGARGFWVGCHAAGLAHWERGAFVAFDAKGALPKGCVVWSVVRTRDGSLWIGTEGAGLMRWKNDRLEAFGTERGVPDGAITAMVETKNGSLWVGGRDGGLACFRKGDFSRPTETAGCDGMPLTVLADDGADGVWVGTAGQGLGHLPAKGEIRWFTRAADGLGSDWVRSLRMEADGTLWIGTNGGLSRLRSGKIATVSSHDGLWDDAISQILEDDWGEAKERQLWLGSNRGIFRLTKEVLNKWLDGRAPSFEQVAYGLSDGMEGLECSSGFGPSGLSLVASENPRTTASILWFPTLRGLARLDVMPLMGKVRGISGDHVAFTRAQLHLGADGKTFDLGDVVAGGDGFGNGSGAGIHPNGNFSKSSVTSNLKDAATSATKRYHRTKSPMVDGVFIPDGGLDPSHQVVISSTGLRAEFPATTGVAWGLAKSGLNPNPGDVFNPSEMKLLGVPMVWLSGNQGITFDLEEIRKRTGTPIERFTSRVCNLHIGSAAFHVLLDGQVVVRRSGLVRDSDWFEKGIVPVDIPISPRHRFLTLAATDDKDDIGLFNRVPPMVFIEKVLVNGTETKPPGKPSGLPGIARLELAPGVSRLDLQYAATSLTSPDKIRFRTRLQPLEDTWQEAGDRREANFAHLAPGDYHFEVIACNPDGVWNLQATALDFRLQPRLWQQPWFAPLVVGLLVSVITIGTVAVVRVRHRRHLRRIEQLHAVVVERARIARDIHDDLGAGLTEVALLSELARADLAQPEKAALHLDQVFQSARRMTRAIDEIVWAVNPKNDLLERSLDFVCKSAQDFLRSAGIALRIERLDDLPERMLSSSRRHHLYLTVRETLNNVVKHAQATEVHLRLSANPTLLTVEIRDNGCGFAADEVPSSRHGLDGMATRMAEVGSSADIASIPGQGTTVTLRLPLHALAS